MVAMARVRSNYSGAILRSAVMAALSMLAIVGCRPSSETHPMPVLVRADTNNNGWQVEVPICGPDDGMSMFDLSTGGTVTESRSTGASGPARQVDLRVNANTLRSGQFNPDEVKVVSNRGALSDPLKLTFFLTTVEGFAQFDTEKMNFEGDSQYLVTGRSPPVISNSDEALLGSWCENRD
jgi:hypothetical protein